MTAREKVKLENPWLVDEYCREILGGVHGCPHNQGYKVDELCQHGGVSDATCWKCWDQEIPGTEENIEKESKTVEKKTKAQLIEEINGLRKELDTLEKYKKYEDAADELAAFRDSLIKANFSRDEAMTLIYQVFKTQG